VTNRCISIPESLISGYRATVQTSANSKVHVTIKSSRSGTFPVLLYDLLYDAETDGRTRIVSWQSHGRAFRVHDTNEFVASVLPRYFHQTRYASFQRQLGMYGFVRITTGRIVVANFTDKCVETTLPVAGFEAKLTKNGFENFTNNRYQQ
jgi:HSF-type DNA-binding